MGGRPAWLAEHDVLRDALEASPHQVVAVGPDGRIDYANERTLRTFGYTDEQLLGLPVEVLLADDLHEAHRAHRRRFEQQWLPRPMGIGLEVQGRRRDGTMLPVEVSLTPLETPTGRWVLCAIADITTRRLTEQRLERVNRAYRLVAALNEAIVRAASPQELYADACRIAVEEGGYLGAWVARKNSDLGVETLATAGRLDDYIAGIDIVLDPSHPRGNGPTATALRTGEAFYSAEFVEDERTRPWHEAALRHGIRSSATLPLHTGGQTVAALCLWSDEPGLFDERLVGQLSGLARNLSFALEGFVAKARLELLVRQRSGLLRRLVAAQEEERARIAGDVHDDSVQALAAVDLRLGLLARRVAEAAPGLGEQVEQLQQMVGGVTEGLRHLLFDLEPSDAAAPLDVALREAADHLFEHQEVAWSVTVDGRDRPTGAGDLVLTPGVHAQALRVAKEALINVRKHAHASRVDVVVRPVDEGVEVTVTDDGVGAGHPTAVPGHRGVTTMRDRASLVGGWCRLEAAEHGTTVRFWMPRDVPPVLSLTHVADG